MVFENINAFKRHLNAHAACKTKPNKGSRMHNQAMKNTNFFFLFFSNGVSQVNHLLS
jgi:hypothetical protein